jgi:cytochrome c biogenesis protein CcmG, thiol:disulfide interchange protein DsbE
MPIVAGLLAGALVAVTGLAAVVVLAPDPGAALSSQSLPTIPQTPSPGPSEVAASGSAAPSAGSSGPVGFHIGEPAPALSVPQVGGGTIDIAALKGKPLWIYFMATTCTSCKDEIPLMSGVATRYASTGLVIIAIDVREDEGTVAEFAGQVGAKFPFGLDADGTAQRAWGAVSLPVHFWVDKTGIVRYGALGGISKDVMAKGLAQILPGVTITF